MATCPTCNDTGVVQRPGNVIFARGSPPHYITGTRLCPSCHEASAIDLTASTTTAPPDATPDDLPEAWKAGFNGA